MELELNKASDSIPKIDPGSLVTIDYLNFTIKGLEKKIEDLAEGLISLTEVTRKILKEVAYSDEEDDEDYEDDMEEEVIKRAKRDHPKVEMHMHEPKKVNYGLYSNFGRNEIAITPLPNNRYIKPNLYRSNGFSK